MQGRRRFSLSSLASWHLHGSLHWPGLGPPTTAAQNLAELLLNNVWLPLRHHHSQKFSRGPGADLAIRSRWPTSEAATARIFPSLSNPYGPALHCYEKSPCILGTGPSIKSGAVGTVVTTRTTAMLVCDGAVRRETRLPPAPETPTRRRALRAQSPPRVHVWGRGDAAEQVCRPLTRLFHWDVSALRSCRRGWRGRCVGRQKKAV